MINNLLKLKPCLLPATLALIATCSHAENEEPYRIFPFELNHVEDRIVPIDLNGDGLKDLLTAEQGLLSIYFQKPAQDNTPPFNFSKPDVRLELPGKAVGWDLDWNTSDSNPAEKKSSIRIVALIDGKQIIAWPIVDNHLGEQKILLDNLSGNLPLGAYPLNFVRDINADQRNDYIVPGSDHHRLYLQQPDGSFTGNIQIKSNIWVVSTLSVDNDVTEKIGQTVRIPDIRIRDVNNDNRKDLVSRANNMLEVFLAASDGTYPLQPNYQFDFNAIQERLGEPEFDNIDFSNLSSLTRYSYDARLDDINGDKIEDLLIREAGKVVFYTGTATGMNLEQPQQVLRSSGNVFSALLFDEDEDGLKDLWLLRVEDISLGKAFVWLALSGSIDIEAFIYRNGGEQFARRPHRKKTIKLTFPSLLKGMGILGDIREQARSGNLTRTANAKLGGDGQSNDLVILDEQGIKVHLDVLEEQLSEEDLFLGLIENIRERDEFTVDLNAMLDNIGFKDANYIDQVQGREQDYLLSLGNASDDLAPGSNLLTMDLNNDQRDDIVVLTRREDNTIYGVILFSR